MGLLVACKNEEESIKNEGARVVTTLFIKISDAQGQLSQIWNLAKIQTDRSFISCPYCMQERGRSIQN